MGSSSHRKSGSSARSTGRRRVVIGAEETVRVRYKKDRPEVEAERRRLPRSHDREPSTAGKRIANVKRDERERRQRAIARRRILVGGVALLVLALLVWGLVALAKAPIFSITSTEVTGATHLTKAAVIQRAKVPANATLIRLPSREIRAALLSDPWIADVKLVRQYPHTLELRITERTPVAIVDAGGTSLWLVDQNGYWIARRTADTTATLPSIRDVEGLIPKAGERSGSVELQNALAVVNGIGPELRRLVRTVSAPSVDRTTLILPRGVQALVGSSEDIATKDERIRGILAEHKNVVFVNVRVVNRPTWRGLDTND